MFLTQAQMDLMVCRETMNRQIGMSVNARALYFSKRFKKEISAY